MLTVRTVHRAARKSAEPADGPALKPPAAEVTAQAGRRIRAARRLRRMSIKDLAFAAGIDPGFLCYIETGRKNPSLSTLVKLAEALGLSLPRLFGAVGHKPSSGERCLGAFMRVVSWSSRRERALFHEILSAYARAARSRSGGQRETILKGAASILRGLGKTRAG